MPRDVCGAWVHSQLDSAATGQRSVVEAIAQRQTRAKQALFDMRCCRMLNPRKSMPHPASGICNRSTQQQAGKQLSNININIATNT
ncbi:hypothetical protein [Xanthomonas axonopodis]|uniref:hypothetical protein n=1 Tax=Xanthomonas axonopodis TaxID=53413 RepID=UPI0011178F86|nr:hypothetical protein [Xanthomonas axonopodis]